MTKYVLIALGGSVGALLRYAVGGAVQNWLGGLAPWGTLVVNLSGCFAIGVLGQCVESLNISPHARHLLAIGVLGAFTTFSTFSLETLNLLRDRQYLLAGANVLVSVVAGLLLAYLGMLSVRAVLTMWK